METGKVTPSPDMARLSVDELHLLRGLLAFPNEASLELLRELSEVWPWLEAAGQDMDAGSLDDWRSEYCRLFFNGEEAARCPHFSSAYEGAPNNAASKVAGLYMRAGLPLCNIPPDFIGSELNLLAELLESEHDLGSSLLHEAWLHMAGWIPQFAACLRRETRLALYRVMADRLEQLFT